MRGATAFVQLVFSLFQYFNPRAHEGRDLYLNVGLDGMLGYFNPRAHEGRDIPFSLSKPTSVVISIHAPMRGAT